MQRRIADIEYQQMLLGRFSTSQYRADDGLDRSAYLLLSRLHLQGPMSIGELSTALRLDTSTVHRQTGSAMRAGMLERIPDPEGGIARKFTVTEMGEERLLSARARSLRALERILGEWPSEDVNQFADYLNRFNLDIEGYSDHSLKDPTHK
ncbi:MarR family transcriptional regulator [Pseudoclavibacter sp. RFBJ3]|uniref:MarR family winged helix-turn-helix transcriptional regulator n=1 Tax=unclassified Pseudoclavibacter TaxID=2615177 RepID=UPI000CE8639B|nr:MULTISPECIES: MarR family winged helix-turn-helix transcriptional regulator [unclassified Pseudoclavibacter]PPF87294.1 MarR family transcriptional regulator [Pseudoclavibacter sp. RFBJ5]PPF90298.1 MarR family transcriptional regulator [Pseudoclavibacter sp. RFBJ3]PPG00816.1 MarR family transcriptional regulator [Pseudoclavibacter sp. RFBH5]PPG26072.1 MarR family transcriptional regulator [Pseudoclavibacter sp. RFBI4]